VSPLAITAAKVVDYTFPADLEADGWVTSADPSDPDRGPWSWWGPGAHLNGSEFFWDFAPPDFRFTWRTKTLGGFTPNGLVTARVTQTWMLGQGFPGGAIGGNPDKFMGTEINGVRGKLPFPVFVTGNPRSYLISTFANASGEIEVKIGIDNVGFEASLETTWVSLEAWDGDPFPLADILYDTAYLTHSFAVPVSITRQGFAFDPGEAWEDYDFPGKRAAVVGLHEVVRQRPTLRGVVMATGERQLLLYRPGGSWGDHPSVSGGRRYTPGAMRTALATDVYLTDVVCTWKRLRGDYIAVSMPKAICRKYDIHGADKNEGELGIEIEAVQDLSTEGATPNGTPLYYIDTFPAGTEF